jgi:ABC-2 type transport system permease protein
MRQLLSIAGKDLRLRMRDRSVLIVGVLAPGLLAVIFSLVFGDVLDPSGGAFTADYGYVDLDDTEASQSLGMALGVIAESDQFTIVELDSVADAEAAIEDGELESVFVAPAGFGVAVATGVATEIEVITDVDAEIASGIAVAIAEGYAENVERVALTVAGAMAAGAEPSAVPAIIEEARAAVPVATIGDIKTEIRQMSGATFAMAGMAVFFLFFTVQFGVASLLEERRLGTWDRLLAAPLHRRTIVGAKALVSFVLGLVSMAVLMIGATIGLGADWGDPIAVAALVVIGVIAATGVMAIVAATAKTVEGAGNVQAIIAVTLGMLGGTFVPIASDGGILASLSKLTPHAWFLSGLNDLAGGGGIERVVPSLLAIGAFALVAWVIAIGAFARKGMA